MANHMNQNPKTGKKKGTKAALAASFAALLLCGATLVGTTFAWFTDTATTGSNTIQAGELNIVLEKWNETTGQYESVELEDGTGIPVFNHTNANTANADSSNTLWEPGKTQVEYFRIKNEGNLALKYQVWLNTEDKDGEQDLYKAMQYQIKSNVQLTKDASGNIDGKVGENELIAKDYKGVTLGNHNVSLPGADNKPADRHLAVDEADVNTHYFALAVNMKEGAGNEYMNGQVNFSLSIQATQDTVEYDSFDNQYDADAVNHAVSTTVSKNQKNVEVALTGDLGSISVDELRRLTGDELDANSDEEIQEVLQMVQDGETSFSEMGISGKADFDVILNYQFANKDANPKGYYLQNNQYYKADGTQLVWQGIDPNHELIQYKNETIDALKDKSYANDHVGLVVQSDDIQDDDICLYINSVFDNAYGHNANFYLDGKLTVTNIQQGCRVLSADSYNSLETTSQTNNSAHQWGTVENPHKTTSYQDFVWRSMITGFWVGMRAESDDVAGKTATLELRLYETDENGTETGNYTVLNSYTHTFE